MPATMEDLNIVWSFLGGCKTKKELIEKSKISEDKVSEVLDTLRNLGKINKTDFNGEEAYCPISETISVICNCNKKIRDAMSPSQPEEGGEISV